MPRVLVVGSTGQVGLEFSRAAVPDGWTLIAAAHAQLDLARPETLANAFSALKPDAVINAAAYTAVDKAESEPELAFQVNRDGSAALAAAAAARGAALVHISTDYVFDGSKAAPYVETDPKAPLGVYGRSKAEGEDAVLAAHPHVAIVRTSWVYSPHRTNFVKTMLRLAETRDEVRVVADQIGRPTAAADVAGACVAIAQRLLTGDAAASSIFHYAGEGDATWADFAEAIFAELKQRGRNAPRVHRITTGDYPTAARRPANSRLDTAKFERTFDMRTRPWREALGECMSELLGPA